MDPTTWLWLAIGGGVLAVVYGVVSMLSDPQAAGRQRADAGNRRGDPGRRPGLSEPSVHDDRASSAWCCSSCSASR